jgi:hypothetical protein
MLLKNRVFKRAFFFTQTNRTLESQTITVLSAIHVLCSCKNNSHTYQHLLSKHVTFFQQTSLLEKYNFSQGTIFLYQGKPQPNEHPLHLTLSKHLITQIA